MSVPITRHIKIETTIAELDKESLIHSFVTNVPADLFDEFVACFVERMHHIEKEIANEE